MDRQSCRGCVRARDDGGIAVPGSGACLACRRALAHAGGASDLWVAGPPGGTPVECDDRQITLAVPLAPGTRCAAMAFAAGFCAACALAGHLPAAAVAAVLFAGMWLAAFRGGAVLRHTWGIRDSQVRHTIAAGLLKVTRRYPAGHIRAFHCTGRHANGRVRFHCGPYTLTVAELAPPPDNEWLMRHLNDRLAEERRAQRAMLQR